MQVNNEDNTRIPPGQRGMNATILISPTTIIDKEIPLFLTSTNDSNIPVVDIRQLPGTFENNVRSQGLMEINKVIIEESDKTIQNVITPPIKQTKKSYCFLYNVLYVLRILLILSIILILLGIVD